MKVEKIEINHWPFNTSLAYEYVKPECLLNTYQEQNGDELARWVFMEIDGSKIQALISCNYSVCSNHLKTTFNAKKVNVTPAPHSFIALDKTTNILIDSNLIFGSKRALIKSDLNDIFFSIKIDDLQEITNAQVVDLNVFPIHKAKVSFVSPESMRNKFESTLHPFFGVSLQNSNFVRSKLLASLEWIANRFNKCTVLIGDSIHRITLQANYGLDENLSLEKALYIGKKFLENEAHVFKKFSHRSAFDFVFCSEIQQMLDYQNYHYAIQDLFITDEAFRNSVRFFAESYHTKRKHIISENDWESLISNSCKYFLEEFAIFAYLHKTGRTMMIYPGSFSTLSEIAAGKHPGALDELKQLIVVSLHIKKR